jgi:hypothetical protein
MLAFLLFPITYPVFAVTAFIARAVIYAEWLQFDQGYANNGPVSADARSDNTAAKISSQMAWARNLNADFRSSFRPPTSHRMTVLSRSRSSGVSITLS